MLSKYQSETFSRSIKLYLKAYVLFGTVVYNPDKNNFKLIENLI